MELNKFCVEVDRCSLRAASANPDDSGPLKNIFAWFAMVIWLVTIRNNSLHRQIAEFYHKGYGFCTWKLRWSQHNTNASGEMFHSPAVRGWNSVSLILFGLLRIAIRVFPLGLVYSHQSIGKQHYVVQLNFPSLSNFWYERSIWKVRKTST